MPVFTIDAPNGASPDAKERMMKEIHYALDEAYHFPDTRGWLREYTAESVAQDGRVGAEPARPVCSLEVPELAAWTRTGNWSRKSRRRSKARTRASPTSTRYSS